MSERLTNIYNRAYEEGEVSEGETPWRFLDLSGDHLGVRIEEIPVGGTSSHHHYHTAEEEHVLMLEGSATLHLGDTDIELSAGDRLLRRICGRKEFAPGTAKYANGGLHKQNQQSNSNQDVRPA